MAMRIVPGMRKSLSATVNIVTSSIALMFVGSFRTFGSALTITMNKAMDIMTGRSVSESNILLCTHNLNHITWSACSGNAKMNLLFMTLVHGLVHLLLLNSISICRLNRSATCFPHATSIHVDTVHIPRYPRQQGHIELVWRTDLARHPLQNTWRHAPAFRGSLMSSKQIAHVVSSILFRGLCCLQKSVPSQALRLHLRPRPLLRW